VLCFNEQSAQNRTIPLPRCYEDLEESVRKEFGLLDSFFFRFGDGTVVETIDDVEDGDVLFVNGNFCNGINQNFKDILYLIPFMLEKEQRLFYHNIEKFENMHSIRWFLEFEKIKMKFGFPEINNTIYGNEYMYQYSRSLLNEYGNKSVYKLGVVGPGKSGKSTLMSILFEELLLRLISNGEWKRTFIYIFDSSIILEKYNELESLYYYCLDTALLLLSIQKPCFTNHVNVLRTVFETIPNCTTAPFIPKCMFSKTPDYKKFGINLQEISNDLFFKWNYSDSWFDLYCYILDFPRILSSAFGFTKCVFIMDDFDTLNKKVFFASFLSRKSCLIYVDDVVKMIISQGSYMIGSKDQKSFLKRLYPRFSQSRDISNIHFVSPYSIIPTSSKSIILIYFESSPIPINFTQDSCGGVPYYVSVFDEMLKTINNTEDAEETQMLLISLAQQIVDGLYNSTIKVCRVQVKDQ